MALTTALAIEELGRIAATSYSGRTLRMALVNHASAPATDAGICAWLAQEVSGNGYARASRTLTGSGAYDSGADARWELADQDFTFSAVGGSILYSHAVLLVGGAATGVVGAIATATDVNVGTNVLTLAGHGLTDGTRVTVRTDGGTLPTGLTAGGIYYAKAVDADSLRLCSDEAATTAVDITAAGSGSLTLINASGSVHSIWTESPARSILAGASYTYRWSPFLND